MVQFSTLGLAFLMSMQKSIWIDRMLRDSLPAKATSMDSIFFSIRLTISKARSKLPTGLVKESIIEYKSKCKQDAWKQEN